MKIISIEHASKSFGAYQVLKDINLTVDEGEIFTLLGENGAGKSTLINILTTLSTADEGKITIMGQDVRKAPEKIREIISLNAQSNTLDDEFTGLENLMIIARLRSIPSPKKEIAKLAERLDLNGFLHKKVNKYSGGMRRRVDIAMSLLGKPQIIFLDEPTAGVDPKNRLEIWKIIREMKAAGKTIFLTTQYLEEADQLSDHIGFMNAGKIVLYGTPDEIKQNTKEQVHIRVPKAQISIAGRLLNETGITAETNDCSPCTPFQEKDTDSEDSQNKAGKAQPLIKLDKQHLQQAIEILAGNHITIEKVTPLEMRLEEIFLNVTSPAVDFKETVSAGKRN